MITYDGLRVLIMAEDDLTCCFGLYGSLFHPYIVKKIWVVFQGACDGNVKISRNILRKSKKSGMLNLQKIDFFKWPVDRSERTDRPIRPIRAEKKWGVWGGFAPRAKNIFF